MIDEKTRFDSRFSLRLRKENHEKLRKLSFLTGKSQSELLDEVMDEVLERNKKLLTNADIMA